MDKRNKSNPIYYKLRAIKDGIMGRCYNKNNPKYPTYGARGVHVDEKWHILSGFLDDVDKVDGWDEELFLAGRLRLDKDKKSRENLIYSRNTCSWITPEENSKYKPNAQREMNALSPEGKIYTFFNQTDFAEEHGLDRPCIHACLHNKHVHHLGWQFWYEGEPKPKKRTLYVADNGTSTFIEFSIADLSDRLNIPRHKVYSAYRPERSSKVDGYTFSKRTN